MANLPTLLTLMVSVANSGDKAFCRLGALENPAVQAAAIVLGLSDTTISLLPDTDEVRHTLAQQGIAKRKAEEASEQIPIAEADIENVTNWLGQPTAVRHGQVKPGKQPRLELPRIASAGTTVAILEWRPGRQQLALVTMYKKRPTA